MRAHAPRIEAPADRRFRLESVDGRLLAEVHGGSELTPVLADVGSYRVCPEVGSPRHIIISEPTWPLHPLVRIEPASLEAFDGVAFGLSGASVTGWELLPDFIPPPANPPAPPTAPGAPAPLPVRPPPPIREWARQAPRPSRPAQQGPPVQGLRHLRRGRAVIAVTDLDAIPAIRVAVAASRGADMARAFKDRALASLFQEVYNEAIADAGGTRRNGQDRWSDAQLRAVTVCLWALLDEEHFAEHLQHQPLPAQARETLKWLKTARQHAPSLVALLHEVREEYRSLLAAGSGKAMEAKGDE